MVGEWIRSLSSGIDEIDMRLEELFRRADWLFAAMSQGKGKNEINSTMRFLEDFVEVHFDIEEKYMNEFGYPDYEPHRQEHVQFRKDFSCLRGEFEAGGASTLLVLKVERFVFDWITHHIDRADRPFYEFLRSRAAGQLVT